MAESKSRKKGRPRSSNRSTAATPEVREQELIALSMDLAEEQLRNGTASPSVITHFLRMGSMREELEQQLIQERVMNLTAKTHMIESSENTEKLYQEAIRAMRVYNGTDEDEELS